MKNPHNMLSHNKDAEGNFIDSWTCDYCRQSGTYAEMNEHDARHDGVEYKECTHVYPPCEDCGQTPECAPDCKGILGALHCTEGVYVCGELDKTVH